MAVMSARLRQEMKRYNEGLLRRVLRAACPHCKAKPGKPCRGTTGWPTKGTHTSRHNEAKRVGLIHGRWFDEAKYGLFL
jgi:hypothetical protein